MLTLNKDLKEVRDQATSITERRHSRKNRKLKGFERRDWYVRWPAGRLVQCSRERGREVLRAQHMWDPISHCKDFGFTLK